jgi:hypothetical protein
MYEADDNDMKQACTSAEVEDWYAYRERLLTSIQIFEENLEIEEGSTNSLENGDAEYYHRGEERSSVVSLLHADINIV